MNRKEIIQLQKEIAASRKESEALRYATIAARAKWHAAKARTLRLIATLEDERQDQRAATWFRQRAEELEATKGATI